jgi:hypothetical protein
MIIWRPIITVRMNSFLERKRVVLLVLARIEDCLVIPFAIPLAAA